MKKEYIINRLRKGDIKQLFNENYINKLYLAWSFARDESTENSDIDLIFSLSKNPKLTLLKLIKIQNFLEWEFHKKVDLVEENSINKHYKEYINNDKLNIF